MNLWIKNGHIVDPATGRDEVGDVYVVDGKIADTMTGEYAVSYTHLRDHET